jgi:transcriptional regulator with XRE-family HTH domain
MHTNPNNHAALVAGRNIRWLRQQQRLTQANLADAAGIGQTYVGQLERGEKNATLDVLANLASALGVSVAALLQPRARARPGSQSRQPLAPPPAA